MLLMRYKSVRTPTNLSNIAMVKFRVSCLFGIVYPGPGTENLVAFCEMNFPSFMEKAEIAIYT
jgi:hypothetical protein